MEKKFLYLHIGIHKTGTSTIQDTFFNNRKLLEKYNVYYMKDWWKNHSVPIYSMFCDEPQNYHANIKHKMNIEDIHNRHKLYIEQFRKEINATKCSRIVISGEDISLLKYNNILKMIDFFKENIENVHIKVIVYLRDRVTLASSLIQQMVKDEVGVLSTNYSWINNIYRDRLEDYIKIFPIKDISICKFEEAIKNENGLIGDFLQNIDIDKRIMNELKLFNSNESISNNAVKIISYINQKYPLNENINGVRSFGDTHLLHNISGYKFILSQEYRNKLFINQNDLIWLKENTKIDYISNKTKIEYDYKNIENLKGYLDIIDIFDCLDDVIKILVYEFFRNEKNISKSSAEENIYNLIIDYIMKKYSTLIGKDESIDNIGGTNKLIEKEHVKKQFKKKEKEKFLNEITVHDEIDNADFFREIALLCEKHEQFETAYYFMKIAKKQRPKGPKINEKLNTYKQLIR